LPNTGQRRNQPDRRRVLAAGLAALGGAMPLLVPANSGAAEAAPLKKLAAEKGLLYGTTISAAQISTDHEFVDLVLQQAGLVVAENDMKWQVMNRGKPADDDYGPRTTSP